MLIDFSERSTCAICGSSQNKVYRAFRDIPVVQCSECGFLYSSKVMGDDMIQKYYRENFGSQRHLEGQRVNAATNSVVLSKLLDWRGLHSWLDIGTGYGFLLKWLQEKFHIETEGVELSLQESSYARDHLGLKVHSTPLSQAPVPRGHYDVVSSFEVIEHIRDPVSFVKETAEYVRPGGLLVIMTDNFGSEIVNLLRGRFPKWIPHTHVSHFAPESLRRCIKSVPGLTMEAEASYSPWDLVGRRMLCMLRPPISDEQAFDLRSELCSEMNRPYKLYHLRRRMNPLWARVTLRNSLDRGALMYGVCRKEPAFS
jgi:2-polyprenyl-3-methyl-5-hydroxy-6-metoxy-1,4-benzoquinol methylase